MIRKPAPNWQRPENPALAYIRTAGEVAKGGAQVARRGGHVARGVVCFFFAILWGFAALAGGLLAGDIMTFLFVGAMAAFMAWAGRRAFARARGLSG